MVHVKEFWNDRGTNVDTYINEFLSINKHIQVIDIKYNVFLDENNNCICSALLIYKVRKREPYAKR